MDEEDNEIEVGCEDFEENVDENEGFEGCYDEMVDLNRNEGCEEQFDKSFIPWVGMEFNSIEEGYHFYNRYARGRGFGTRKSTSHYSRRTNAICRKVFVCEKQGSKRTNDPRQAGKDVKRRPDTREECLYKLKQSLLYKLKQSLLYKCQEETGYAGGIFSLFQDELKQSLLYKCQEIGGSGVTKMYEVKRSVADGSHQIVSFEATPEISVSCTCKKFEGEGILCRHIFRLFFQMDVDTIPKRYILFRWSINARYTSSATLETANESQTSNVSPYMIYSFQSAMYRISNSICLSPQHWGVAMPKLKAIIDELENLSLKSASQVEQNIHSSVEATQTESSATPFDQIPQIVLRDPSRVKSKGRPKTGNRLKSSLEMNMASQVKRRKCGICQQVGHYMNTCSLNKEKASQQDECE